MILEKLKTLLNHERYQAISILIACVILVWIYACESKTQSILYPNRKVTRAQLEIELNTYLATADLRFADLAKQDEFKQTVFQHSLLWVQTGTINPIGAITTIAAILGIGATVDNVRKRKELKTKTNNVG